VSHEKSLRSTYGRFWVFLHNEQVVLSVCIRERRAQATEAGIGDHVCSIEEIVGSGDRRTERAGGRHDVMVEENAAGWMGFACKKCGAPLAVQRSRDRSKPGDHAASGWRVTCTACGATEYYEPGTPMVRITASHEALLHHASNRGRRDGSIMGDWRCCRPAVEL